MTQRIEVDSEIPSGQGTIYVDEIQFLAAPVLVDDFHDDNPRNELGGDSGIWEINGGTITRPVYVSGELKVDYDVTSPSAAASSWTQLTPTNLLQHRKTVVFRIRGEKGSEEIAVQLMDCDSRSRPVKISDYLVSGITTDWSRVAIPRAAFTNDMDRTCVEQLDFLVSSEPWLRSGRGTVYIDDLILERRSVAVPLIVDRFDDRNDWNALKGVWTCDASSEATIECSSSSDPVHRYGNYGCGYRIHYDNPDSSSWSEVYAGLTFADFTGLDVTDYAHLRFHLKGAVGDEVLRVYLIDRSGTASHKDELIVADDDWREVKVHLDDFCDTIDLSNLGNLKIVFEGLSSMGGEIYLDNVGFAGFETYLPVGIKEHLVCPDLLPNCSSPYNNYEPNNHRCSAIKLSSRVPIQPYICSEDDIDDYYYIDITDLNSINVQLSGIPVGVGVDYDLYLYYGNEWVAGSNDDDDDDEEINYSPSQTGRYYIRVYPFKGYSRRPYTLEAKFE